MKLVDSSVICSYCFYVSIFNHHKISIENNFKSSLSSNTICFLHACSATDMVHHACKLLLPIEPTLGFRI